MSSFGVPVVLVTQIFGTSFPPVLDNALRPSCLLACPVPVTQATLLFVKHSPFLGKDILLTSLCLNFPQKGQLQSQACTSITSVCPGFAFLASIFHPSWVLLMVLLMVQVGSQMSLTAGKHHTLPPPQCITMVTISETHLNMPLISHASRSSQNFLVSGGMCFQARIAFWSFIQ